MTWNKIGNLAGPSGPAEVSVDTGNLIKLGSDNLVFIGIDDLGCVKKIGDTMTGSLKIEHPTGLAQLQLNRTDALTSNLTLNVPRSGVEWLQVRSVVSETNFWENYRYRWFTGHVGAATLITDRMNVSGGWSPSPDGGRLTLDCQGTGDNGLGTGFIIWNQSSGRLYSSYSGSGWVIGNSATTSLTCVEAGGGANFTSQGPSPGFILSWNTGTDNSMLVFRPSIEEVNSINLFVGTGWFENRINLTHFSHKNYRFLGDWNPLNGDYSDGVGAAIAPALVWYNQTLYSCTYPYVSGPYPVPADPPDVDTAKWAVMPNNQALAANPFWFYGKWAANQLYYSGRSHGVGVVEGSDGNLYRSLTDNNVSNDPTTSPTHWRQI